MIRNRGCTISEYFSVGCIQHIITPQGRLVSVYCRDNNGLTWRRYSSQNSYNRTWQQIAMIPAPCVFTLPSTCHWGPEQEDELMPLTTQVSGELQKAATLSNSCVSFNVSLQKVPLSWPCCAYMLLSNSTRCEQQGSTCWSTVYNVVQCSGTMWCVLLSILLILLVLLFNIKLIFLLRKTHCCVCVCDPPASSRVVLFHVFDEVDLLGVSRSGRPTREVTSPTGRDRQT